MGADLAAGFGAMAAIVDADRQNLVRIGDGRPQRDRVERDRPRRLAGLHRDPVDSGLERGPEIGPMRVERRDAVALDRAPARATVVNVAGQPHYGRPSPADCSECRAIPPTTRRPSWDFPAPPPPPTPMAH